MVTRGARVAITAGSRGTGDLPAVLRPRSALRECEAGETLRLAGPLFPPPYDENGDLRSPFS